MTIDVKATALDTDGKLLTRAAGAPAGITRAALAADAAFTAVFAPLTTVTVTDVTGTSDTIAAGDLGKVLRYTDAGLVTVTLPVGIAVGSIVELLFWGAAGGAVQDDGTSVVHAEGTVAQYKSASCLVVATSTWSVVGTA